MHYVLLVSLSPLVFDTRSCRSPGHQHSPWTSSSLDWTLDPRTAGCLHFLPPQLNSDLFLFSVRPVYFYIQCARKRSYMYITLRLV